MRQVELHHGAATDVGLVREVNEDAFLAAPPVFVVADGMGGHDGGDVASAIVVEEFGRLADDGYDPRRGADAVAATPAASASAGSRSTATQQISSGRHQWYAGTTAVVALLVEDDDGPKWLLANLGDSRIYRFADDVLEQVSVDHSVVQELIEAGAITSDDAATHPERHVITRALGGPEPAEADYFLLPLPSVERLVLCSDGVSGMIDDDAIAGSSARPPTRATRPTAWSRRPSPPAAGTTPPRWSSMWWDWWPRHDYDSARQMESLEQKLGALP